jgi:hypothetical protein
MEFPYSCEIEIDLESPLQADQVMRVMKVDREIGDRVVKEFRASEGSSTLTM